MVQRSAQALSTLDGVGEFVVLGVEDICAVVDSASSVCDVAMALLADGDWAIGIGITPQPAGEPRPGGAEDHARAVATAALKASARPGHVYVKVGSRGNSQQAEDIAAVFALLGFVLAKRSNEGRRATSLVRGGLNQNEAAAELGISKQAMSQRLQAAGWAAETSGWALAVHLIEGAERGPRA